jgi:DinB superfamily
MTSQDRLNRFAAHGKDFQEVLSTIPEANRYTMVEGGWSAAYVVHHMADGELHFASRYLHAIGDVSPNIQPFDEEAYPERVNYAKRQVKTSLAAIVGIRALVSEVLTNASDSDWDQVSQHPELGPVTLSELFEKADSHIVGHTQQLREISAHFK